MGETWKPTKIVADGDLDGFVAASILHQYLGLPAEFPHPARRKGLVVEDAISVEISPSMGVTLRNTILIDHHEFNGIYFFEEGTVKELKKIEGARSAAEVAVEYLKMLGYSVDVPSDIMEFVAKVDSSPAEVKDDPRYIGYRVLLPNPQWRNLYRNGIKGVRQALELFENVGEKVAEVAREAEKYVGVKRFQLGDHRVAIVYPKIEELKVDGYDILSYVVRSKMMQEEEHSDIVVMIWGQTPTLRVSIASKKPDVVKASEIAKLFGGGGRDTIAGGSIEASTIDEAVRKIRRKLEEFFGEKSIGHRRVLA